MSLVRPPSPPSANSPAGPANLPAHYPSLYSTDSITKSPLRTVQQGNLCFGEVLPLVRQRRSAQAHTCHPVRDGTALGSTRGPAVSSHSRLLSSSVLSTTA